MIHPKYIQGLHIQALHSGVLFPDRTRSGHVGYVGTLVRPLPGLPFLRKNIQK